MRKEKIALFAFCCLLFLPPGASGQTLEAYFAKVCSEASVPKHLAMTIAKHESGMNPFAVNVAGRPHQPRSREEAKRIIQEARKTGKSHDIGLLQINSAWPAKWGINPESLLEPETNIKAGVKILAGEIARHGFTWKAVGSYHSPTPERGRRYAWSIYNNGQGPAAPAGSKHHAEQKTGDQGILLYRRGGGDSLQCVQGRLVRF